MQEEANSCIKFWQDFHICRIDYATRSEAAGFFAAGFFAAEFSPLDFSPRCIFSRVTISPWDFSPRDFSPPDFCRTQKILAGNFCRIFRFCWILEKSSKYMQNQIYIILQEKLIMQDAANSCRKFLQDFSFLQDNRKIIN